MAKNKLPDMMEKPFFLPDPEERFTGQPFDFGYIVGEHWRVKRNYSYRTLAGEKTTVRKGFVFDFASVPRLLNWLYPPAGDGENPYGIAAMWHDWLFVHRAIGGRKVEQPEVDALFREIMLYLDVSKFTAGAMYRTVRTLGWWEWNKRKKEDIIL